MFAYGELRIHMKLFSMSVIHRKLTFFLARFLLERFMALLFWRKHCYGKFLSWNATGMAIPTTEWRLWRFHFSARRSTATLTQTSSSVSKWNISSSMDWTHGTQRLGTTLLAPQIPRHDTMWLFLMGICKRTCLCSTITRWLGMSSETESRLQ